MNAVAKHPHIINCREKKKTTTKTQNWNTYEQIIKSWNLFSLAFDIATIGRHKCTLKHNHKHPNKYVRSIKCAQIHYSFDAVLFFLRVYNIFFFRRFLFSHFCTHSPFITFDIVKCNTSYSDVLIQSLQYKSYTFCWYAAMIQTQFRTVTPHHTTHTNIDQFCCCSCLI